MKYTQFKGMSTQNDLINYKNVIEEANSLINEQIKLWGGVVSSIQQVGKVTPSSFVNTQKQVNEALTKNVEIQTKLEAVEKKRQATVQQVLTTGASLERQRQREIAQEERKSKALERATQRALEQNRAYNRLQTSWRNAQKSLQDSIVTDGLKAKSTQRLQREFNDLDKRIKQVDAATKNYSKNVGNYRSAMGGLGSLTSQLAGALGLMGSITVSVGLLRDAFNTIKEFDSGLLNVAKTTGLAGDELKKLGVDIRALGQELKVIPINNLLEYATVAGQLGVKGSENIMKFTKALAMLETASDITGQQGGAEIARFLTLVDGGVQNVANFGDEIVRLGNNFAATESEILSNAEAISQNVGIYKIGRQDVLAYAAASKSLGVEAEVVGSTFQKTLGTFERAIRTGKGLGNILDVIGGSAEELKNRFKEDASGVFQDYIKGLNGIHTAGGSVQAQMEANGIVDIRQRRVIGTLAAGYETLERAMYDVENAAGAMQEEFDTAAGKIENQIKAVNVAWDEFILAINTSENTIGNFTIKFLNGVADMINGITRLSNSWATIWGDAQQKGEVSGYQDMMELYEDFDKYENSRNSAMKARQKLMAKERDLQKEIADLQKEAEGKKPTVLGTVTSHLTFGLLGSTQTANEAAKLNQKIEELNGQLGNAQGRIKAVDQLFENYNRTTKETVNTIGEVVELTKEEIKARAKATSEDVKNTKDLLKSQYDLAKIRLERQKADAKYAEDMETYFTKELELANLDYEYKKKLTNLEIKDKKRLAIELERLQEEYTLRIEAIGWSEIAQQEEVFKKLSDGIKKFYEFKQKAREEDEKRRQEGLRNEYDLTQIQNEIDLESLGGNRGGKYWETRQKEIEDWYKYQQDLHKNNAQELLRIDKEYELQNLQLLNDRKNAFKQAMTEMYSSALVYMGAGSLAQFFNGQFEEIWNGADELQEKMAAVMMAIGDIASDVFKAMSESQNAYFQQQFKNLETEKDLAIQFAGDNKEGREAIEKQYDEKKRALQMEQAKREKRLAIAQATINVASAILGALATQPVWVGIAMAALVGVLGAVQLATISSTPLPQFYTGTSNAPEGLALTQERGAEMITDKHGNIKTLGNNKGAQLTYLNKGDKVFTADETTQKLNELLISSGVSPIVNVSGGSGMSKDDMREVLNDTLAKQPKNSIIFDENGIKAFTSKENRRTILKNRNVRI